MSDLDSCLPHTSAFAVGESSWAIFQVAPSLPVLPGSPPTTATIAASPAPTATPPPGSGITCPIVSIVANPLSGAMTDLLIQVIVSTTATPGDYPILLTFKVAGTMEASIPRNLIIPVRARV